VSSVARNAAIALLVTRLACLACLACGLASCGLLFSFDDFDTSTGGVTQASMARASHACS